MEKKKNELKSKDEKKDELKAKIKTELRKLADEIGERSVLIESFKKALAELAKAAADGDLDAIKLLNEYIQDSKELKLRKELFGV